MERGMHGTANSQPIAIMDRHREAQVSIDRILYTQDDECNETINIVKDDKAVYSYQKILSHRQLHLHRHFHALTPLPFKIILPTFRIPDIENNGNGLQQGLYIMWFQTPVSMRGRAWRVSRPL